MKKVSLLKKIGSAFTAVAMLASVGTVALAANPGAYVPGDESVKITDITWEASGTVQGLYNVTVKCEVGSDALDKNAIGVTMLTYAKKDNSLSVTADDYDQYDESTMQIVGIDQKQRADGVSVVDFTFAVTTDDNNGENAYAVQPGKAAVILVSGDGLNPAAGLLKIEEAKEIKTAATVTVADYDPVVSIYGYDTAATVLTKLKESFVAPTVDVNDAAGTKIGTVVLSADYITAVAKVDNMTYTATAVVPANAEVTSEYDVTIPADGITATFNFGVDVQLWEADTIALVDSVDKKIALADVDAEDDLKALFTGEDKIKASIDGNAAAVGYIDVEAGMIAADPDKTNVIQNAGTFTAGDKYYYIITVPAGTYDEFTTAADETIAVSVEITEEAVPTALKGDVSGNGLIEPEDLTMLVNHLAGTEYILGEDGLYAADISGNVLIEPEDLTMLVNHLAGTEYIVQP